MKIAIRPYLPDDLSRILDLYNSLVVGRVPHCWPVMSSSLDETLQAGPETPSSLDETLQTGEAEPRLLEQAVLVADSGGDGFIHVGRQATNKWQEDEIGVIRFLAYRRGERAVGAALLAAAESWMRERDLRRSVVMPQPWRYPFYAFPHAYLSDHLDHVQALLRFRGYTKTGGEVFLDWLDMQPKLVGDSSGLDYELCVEDHPGAGSRPGLRLRAVQDGDGIGECELVSGAESSAADEAHDFAFCDWLGVNEKHQGRGLGRFLLAHAMYLAREHGYRHGAISTAFDNDRAFLFYTNHGFRVVDWTYEFARELS